MRDCTLDHVCAVESELMNELRSRETKRLPIETVEAVGAEGTRLLLAYSAVRGKPEELECVNVGLKGREEARYVLVAALCFRMEVLGKNTAKHGENALLLAGIWLRFWFRSALDEASV